MSFIAYDNCFACNGEGFITFAVPLFDDFQMETDQCPECKKLDDKYMKANYQIQEQRDRKYE